MTRISIGISARDCMILAIGDLNKNKNQALLIRALSQLPNEFKLVIAGDGPLRNELEALAISLGIFNRVHLIGFRGDIAELLNACDVFCLTSRREGLPVSLIEAIASGAKVLSTDARGCEDVLGELSQECIVRKQTPEEWAQRISRAVEQRSQALAYQARARKFQTDEAVKVVTGIYEDALQMKEPPETSSTRRFRAHLRRRFACDRQETQSSR